MLNDSDTTNLIPPQHPRIDPLTGKRINVRHRPPLNFTKENLKAQRPLSPAKIIYKLKEHHKKRVLSNCGRKIDGTLVMSYRVPSVRIARWIVDLLPKHERHNILKAALILGVNTSGKEVRLAQIRVHDRKTSYECHLTLTDPVYDRLWEFALEANIVSYPIMIRTAITIGLGLPGALAGATIPLTHKRPLSRPEWVQLLIKANVKPARPDLIPRYLWQEQEAKESKVI